MSCNVYARSRSYLLFLSLLGSCSYLLFLSLGLALVFMCEHLYVLARARTCPFSLGLRVASHMCSLSRSFLRWLACLPDGLLLCWLALCACTRASVLCSPMCQHCNVRHSSGSAYQTTIVSCSALPQFQCCVCSCWHVRACAWLERRRGQPRCTHCASLKHCNVSVCIALNHCSFSPSALPSAGAQCILTGIAVSSDISYSSDACAVFSLLKKEVSRCIAAVP